MKRLLYGLILLLLSIMLGGCMKGQDKQGAKKESVFLIYYLNSSLTKLEPYDYKLQSDLTDLNAMIHELTGQLFKVPSNLDRQSPIPDKVVFERYHLEDQVLYLFFDNNYALMDSTREILCRAALVKTLTQIDGVDYIGIYTADQPLMNSLGNPVGIMSANDFVDNISNVNAFEKTELILYFADETGQKLVQEKREVVHSVNTSLEKLVIDQLIDGPDRPGLNATLPKDTKLLNVSVNENVCYINFDSAFLNSTLEVRDYIPIYSIVNSLAEAASINQVQITVNGSQDVVFRDSIPLNTLFERNLDYNENTAGSASITETAGGGSD